MPGDVMTVAEWAKRIRVSATTGWRKMRAGEVEVINIGSLLRPQLRVTEEAHRAYLAAHKVASVPSTS